MRGLVRVLAAALGRADDAPTAGQHALGGRVVLVNVRAQFGEMLGDGGRAPRLGGGEILELRGLRWERWGRQFGGFGCGRGRGCEWRLVGFFRRGEEGDWRGGGGRSAWFRGVARGGGRCRDRAGAAGGVGIGRKGRGFAVGRLRFRGERGRWFGRFRERAGSRRGNPGRRSGRNFRRQIAGGFGAVATARGRGRIFRHLRQLARNAAIDPQRLQVGNRVVRSLGCGLFFGLAWRGGNWGGRARGGWRVRWPLGHVWSWRHWRWFWCLSFRRVRRWCGGIFFIRWSVGRTREEIAKHG